MMYKPQLLREQPRADAPDMRHLIGIAGAIESESVRRYAMLEQEMERRGEHETAATFHAMREMEERHQDAVERWAEGHHETVPPAQDFAWRLPPEIAVSWEEVRRSFLLTPYRALAIAVTNEERAFAFYAYIAANATDPEVQRQAEMMAREELAHAAELRVWRRQAWRVEHPDDIAKNLGIETLAAFRTFERRLENDAAEFHRRIARALSTAGDAHSAGLVDAMARSEGEPFLGDRPIIPEEPMAKKPSALLHAAIQPLERASEIYENLIAHAATEELLAAAQTALRSVVERIAALSRRRSEIEGEP